MNFGLIYGRKCWTFAINKIIIVQLPIISVWLQVQVMQEKHINQLVQDSQFFAKCSQELRQIATNSKFEQEKLRRVKKIVALQEKSKCQPQHLAKKLVDNIIIDYLRANKLNFTYSVMMRERNLVSDEIMSKMSLIQQFELKEWFEKQEGYDVSVVELLLAKLADVGERKEMVEMGVQIEVLNKDSTVNNMIINELRLSEVRREVEEREKRHYQKMLASIKLQLSVTIKDELKKQHDSRVKDIKNEYQRQVGLLKERNKEYLINNPKLNPKIQQYLSKIEQLQTKNMNLAIANRQLEQDKITHNCYNNSKIIERQAELKKEKDYVDKKKKQYELALKNLHTSVSDLVAQKEKLHEQPKQTDLFINELKKNKKNKDYMIEEIYGRMAVMEKRIDGLSKDNDNLREQNRQLFGKVKQLEKQKQSWREKGKQIKTEKQKTIMPKPKTKDVILEVSESAIKQQINPSKQHVIDEQQASIENSQQQELFYETKQSHKLQIQKVQAEMRTIKNKLRLLVTQFD